MIRAAEMSGCLEKVIEKLTACRGGGDVSTVRAETKASLLGGAEEGGQCEEASVAVTWSGTEEEEDLLGSGMYLSPGHVKGEPHLYNRGSLARGPLRCPPAHVKRELRPCGDLTHSEGEMYESTGCPSSGHRPANIVKGEPLLYDRGGLKTCPFQDPLAHVKGELRPFEDITFLEGEMYESAERRTVRIKEEPNEEGDCPALYFPADRSDHPTFCSYIKAESLKQDRILPQSPDALPPQKLFSCSDCGRDFTRWTHFLCHQRSHTGEKPFTCLQCGQSFSQRSYYVSHQRVHSQERPFCCFKCGKSFRIKSSLSKHLRSHEAENPFTCALCQKTFIHQGHFMAHQRIHAEEKKFSCPLCGKSFIHHGHFVAHQRSHAQETRYSCPYCHKSFIHHGHFVAHLRIHTGEKPFPCPECGCSFSTHHNLVVHQRLHASSPAACS